jgi:hypothetical protein
MIYHRVHVVPELFAQPVVLDCPTPLGKISVLNSPFVIVEKSNDGVNPVIADKSNVAVAAVIELLFTHAGNDVALSVRLMRVNVLSFLSWIAVLSAACNPGIVIVDKANVVYRKPLPIDVTFVNPLRLRFVNPLQPLIH